MSANHREVSAAVRPDWTDNRGLLGYLNPITEEYAITPFLKLLLRAAQEEREAGEQGLSPQPYFVILDEMNLARVEHYFSDFLSCLESEEKIHLHDSAKVEQLAQGAVPREVSVPANVYFTGTVNIDESTYMFSPKVLDRAFTLELNEVDLAQLGSTEPVEPPSGSLRVSSLPSRLVPNRRPHVSDWQAFGKLEAGELQGIVMRLNRLLADSNRHFGYRVGIEIARFVTLADEQAEDHSETLWAALDLAILEKVLPKFHGTQQELEDVLRFLLVFAIDGHAERGGDGSLDGEPIEKSWELEAGELVAAETEEGSENTTPKFPRTALKVWRMLTRLGERGFTSYIE